VKGKFFIGEIEKDLYDETTQHLFGTHAFGARVLGLGFAPPRSTVKKK
jgi:hypothetical protein